MTFIEEDLEMDIPDVVAGGKFDGASHGLSRCMKAVDFVIDAQLLTRTDSLARNLPRRGPDDRPWRREIARGCSVFNLESWNRKLPHYPVNRVGAGPRNTGTTS